EEGAMSGSNGFLRILTLRCEAASELSSRALDEPLRGLERLALWGHLLACGSCRRFRSQIRLIRSAVRMRAGLPAGTAPDGDTLSQEARHRIARAIDLTAGDDPDGADRSRD